MQPVLDALGGRPEAWLKVSLLNAEAYPVWFDDFTVDHTRDSHGDVDVLAYTEYYPFGKVMYRYEPFEDYRHGYQGDYAKRDEETGWSSFQARMYDPVIGRWISVDPQRQYASPYVGMGNNPCNKVDPDGEWAAPGDYYNYFGEYLGTDGLDDGKVYVVHGFKEPLNGERFIVANGGGHAILQEGDLVPTDVLRTNLGITHQDFKDFSGALFAETTVPSRGGSWEESAAIFSVVRNRSLITGKSIREEFTRKTAGNAFQIAGWSSRNKINSTLADPQAVENARHGLIEALLSDFDYSGGATYWHGTDFNYMDIDGGTGKYAHREFYRNGFYFSDDSHDIFSQGASPRSTPKMYSYKNVNYFVYYKYISTAAYGQTTFMRETLSSRASRKAPKTSF